LASADYKPLLQGLEKIVKTQTNKTFRPVDRELMEFTIRSAIMLYDGLNFSADLAARSTLHDLAVPLARVIDILEHEANYDNIFVALGAPAMLAMSPDQRAVKQAIARYENLLDDLHKLARGVPPPPAKRGKGKPAKANDLLAVVDVLAPYWERATGKRFTQDWHKGAPVTPATQFVHAVVCFIDPKRLPGLPKVTERIVAERRANAYALGEVAPLRYRRAISR
jgi:hypothetical protein